MRRSKADVERYIASVQGSTPSPREVSGSRRDLLSRPGPAAASRGSGVMAPDKRCSVARSLEALAGQRGPVGGVALPSAEESWRDRGGPALSLSPGLFRTVLARGPTLALAFWPCRVLYPAGFFPSPGHLLYMLRRRSYLLGLVEPSED
ncbi:hypothetical protein P7K49_029424 [Saguinus oedipus]|uniref:Uncharacterized protein n=1 Tax=Saguinus oedipus TaxID=9490 RepID=A0ABQ9U7Y6_SAGOE|nr:hypothetical protein P7K49_029424 [Saguinus oedipus]